MKLGTRVTLVTTTVIASVLAVSTYAALKVRRANLEADLGREAHEIAAALRAGIEPVAGSRDEINEMLRHRIRAAREHGELFQLEVLSGGREQRTLDQAWLLLMQAADIEDAPVGRLFDSETGPRSYAMAVPLYDAATLELPRRHPARKPVANIGMRRDTGYIDAEVAATARRIVPLFVIVVIGVALGVRFALRQTVVQPLRRLVEGIDAVGKGDLSRVILAERDDEIGTIAGRFNAMTGSLREAREDGERAASARLDLEERLRHAEKLATIGQMAAEIAHELGTPLNVIGGRARALSKKAGDAAEVTKNAGLISDEVVRITKIIRQVLDFSRPRGPTLTRVRHRRRCRRGARVRPRDGAAHRHQGRARHVAAAARGPRRSRSDPAGLPEPHHQRDPRHARRRDAAHHDRAGRAAKGRAGPVAARRIRGAVDRRHRPRHPRGRPRQDLRAVLHDQGRGAGDGPRPGGQ